MIDGKSANEIFDSIRQHITSGQLAKGETLPPVRELAARLGVNRNTVASAYKRLVTSGLALSLGRNGTVVKETRAPAALEGGNPHTPLTDLSSGNPDTARLPDLARYLSHISRTPRLYGDAPVSPALYGWAQEWMQDAMPTAGDIDLTNGAVDAIERLLCAHLLPGYSLSAARAAAIQQVLSRYAQVLVIVDDHFALLSSTAWHPVLTPQTQHWAVVRSMSKTLGPDLRLAFVASDPTTSARLRLRLNAGSQWVSHLLQDLVYACLTDEAYQHTLIQSRLFYASQQQRLAQALCRHGVNDVIQGDGLNLWLPLATPSQSTAFALAKAGWLVREGEAFGINAPAHGLRITLSTLNDNDINRLAADIHHALSL